MNGIKKSIKFICCYNAGENKAFEEDCVNNFEHIDFEFMSPGTP